MLVTPQNKKKCDLRWHLHRPANGFEKENHVRQTRSETSATRVALTSCTQKKYRLEYQNNKSAT